MRLNHDCIRDILISIADNLEPDELGYISPLNAIGLATSELEKYSQNEVLYWIRQLMDCGIIIPGKKYVSDPLPQIKDLSFTAYQFIDSTRKQSVWEKIKPKLLNASVDSLLLLLEKGIEISLTLIS